MLKNISPINGYASITKNLHYLTSMKQYLFICFMLLCLLKVNHAQDSLAFSPLSANRSGLYFNGFRLNAGERVYTNTFLFANSMGFGIHKNFELHAGLIVMPFSGEGGFGILPMLSVIPRLGYDFAKYHHVSAGVLLTSGGKSNFYNQQIAYSFGSRRNHVGVLFSKNELFMENQNTWYLQYHFFPFKWLSVGAEHLLWSTYKKESSTLFYHQTKSHDPLLPSNIVVRFHAQSKMVFSIGYWTEYASYSDNGFLYLSASFKINKKKRVKD